MLQAVRRLLAGDKRTIQASSATAQALYPASGERQQILAPEADGRMEGVSLSQSGRTLAVAMSDSNRVWLYQRKEGRFEFEERPYCSLEGTASALDYPHDVAFSLAGERELLAVAQRSGSILIYQRNDSDGSYGPEPEFGIRGRRSGLKYSDGVAFLPPDGDYLVACNLSTSAVTFYRRRPGSGGPPFEARPCFVMWRLGIRRPDGLAFSRDGRWLAVANHGNDTVAIYRRRHADGRSGPRFFRRPAAVIADETLRYPHSVAFTPRHQHLAVTCAGANYLNIYRCEPDSAGNSASARWSSTPSQQLLIGSEDTFRHVNACNKMEGGPKGVSVHDGVLAVCRPETHLSLYPIEERAEGLSLRQ